VRIAEKIFKFAKHNALLLYSESTLQNEIVISQDSKIQTASSAVMQLYTTRMYDKLSVGRSDRL
jgi:hypothetical protein